MALPWYWRSQPLQQQTASDIFAKLYISTNTAIATLLESPYPIPAENPHLARYSICAGEPRVINNIPQIFTPLQGQVFSQLEKIFLSSQNQIDSVNEIKININQKNTNIPQELPFIGGWLGWFGYDLAWEIEQLPYSKPDSLPFPVAFWYAPETFAVLDHHNQTLWLAATEQHQLDQMQALINSPNCELRLANCELFSPPSLNFLSHQLDYETAVIQAKKYIQAGDIFQTNLSLRFSTSTSKSGWEIYRHLQQINPSPFASYWLTPWGEVVSCSPERLVKLQGNQAETRPIAGTRKRGATPEIDADLATELLSNTKERAEHIMLVDLERNDLGKVCEWGSVVVDELLTIERYSHVMHLVSNVKGNLRGDINPIDLIKAMFPGGTITGCPKVRCMEIIEELEPVRRSLFYGSCGYLDIRGHLDLNILIRTLLLTPNSNITKQKTVWGQVGAGIVADSDPEREWNESLQKAQAQLQAVFGGTS